MCESRHLPPFRQNSSPGWIALDKNRSALLERAAFAYLAHLERLDRDHKDIEIIRLNAGRLNREAQDTLEYQQPPFNAGSGRRRPARSS